MENAKKLMAARISRNAELSRAGLSSAMMESGMIASCVERHSYFGRQGYKFCPHCGNPIVFVAHCPTCEHDFYSVKAWALHRSRHFPTCPKCKTNKRGKVHVMPAGLKYKKLPNGSFSTNAAKYMCGECGILFAWSHIELKATPIELADKGNNPIAK